MSSDPRAAYVVATKFICPKCGGGIAEIARRPQGGQDSRFQCAVCRSPYDRAAVEALPQVGEGPNPSATSGPVQR